MCKLLVEHKADCNSATTNTNSTPLHIAGKETTTWFNSHLVQQNHTDIVQFLVFCGANVNISSSTLSVPPSTTKRVPIYSGTQRSFSMKSLASIPARPLLMPSPLIVACSLGNVDIVQVLVENGGTQVFEDRSDPNGSSALMVACEQGHYETVAYLLHYFKKKEKLNQQLNQKCIGFHLWTPLHYASSSGHVAICALLLDNGAHLDALDDIGRTPLHHASAKGHPDVVLLLIERGANVEIRDDNLLSSGDDDDMMKINNQSEVAPSRGKTAMDLASESIQYHRVVKAFKEGIAKRRAQQNASKPSIPEIDTATVAAVAANDSQPSLESPFAANLSRKKRELPQFVFQVNANE